MADTLSVKRMCGKCGISPDFPWTRKSRSFAWCDPVLYQGLFLAPTVVSGALKGAIFAADIYEKLGYKVVPDSTESRHDIIQAVEFQNRDAMIAFCEGIQAAAPVDSYVTPEPWAMPGYDCDVIMAAGAFVQGSSIELSADGPVKPPYAVYFQGV